MKTARLGLSVPLQKFEQRRKAKMKTARLGLSVTLQKKLKKGAVAPTIGTVQIRFESGVERKIDFLDEEIDIDGKSISYVLFNLDRSYSSPDILDLLLTEEIESFPELYISRGEFGTAVVGVADVCFEVYDDANDRFVNVPVRRDKINVYVGD